SMSYDGELGSGAIVASSGAARTVPYARVTSSGAADSQMSSGTDGGVLAAGSGSGPEAGGGAGGGRARGRPRPPAPPDSPPPAVRAELLLLAPPLPHGGLGGHELRPARGRPRSGVARGPLGLALRHRRLHPTRVQLPGKVLQRHVDRQRQLGPRLLARRCQPPALVGQLEVLQEHRVALALALERVVVVPPRAREIRERAPEVERRDPEVRRARGQQAEADRRAVVDRVAHMLLAQLAAQPLGLAAGDVEEVLRVRRLDVAL